MGTITPMLDTLLPQVSGRAGDVARVGPRSAQGPLSALRPISGETPSDVPRRTPYPGRAPVEPTPATTAGARSAPQAGSFGPGATHNPASGGALNTASIQLHLSRGADALVRLLGSSGKTGAAVGHSGPLSDGTGPPRATILASLLGQQVATSGVFYESHLARWVRGRYPLSRLIAEPQARLAAFGSVAKAGADNGAADRGAGSNDRPGVSQPVDPRLAAVVRQQAELLAGGAFYWQGEAWPGAPMQWQIHEPAGRDPSTEESAPHVTSLSLQLENMGRFEARLSINEAGVHVVAWTEAETGRSLMAADLAGLRDRLQKAGCGQPSVRIATESET